MYIKLGDFGLPLFFNQVLYCSIKKTTHTHSVCLSRCGVPEAAALQSTFYSSFTWRTQPTQMSWQDKAAGIFTGSTDAF